jgi:hypothetical protein
VEQSPLPAPVSKLVSESKALESSPSEQEAGPMRTQSPPPAPTATTAPNPGSPQRETAPTTGARAAPLQAGVGRTPHEQEELQAIAAEQLQPPQINEKSASAQPQSTVGPAHRPQSSSPAQPAAEKEDAEELRIQPKIGWGGAYLGYKQSGSFGGLNGSVTIMNALNIETRASYGNWSVSVAVRQFSVDFARDTTNPHLQDSKDFRSISVKPGYGIFYLGVEGRTAPFARLSGTTLDWEDVTSLHGLVGIRIERLFAGRRRKPFLLGLDLEGGLPVAASGNGGPQLSSSSGFGLSLKGYGEKALINSESLRLFFGLEGFGTYDQLSLQGTWSGSSGTAKRTIQDYGARTYLKLDF